ncbi:hypothetical protein QL996_12655 [Planococcus sp. APC 4015]|nr:hypothetical protein [Planococcus sp. APC 4015]
MTTQMREPAAKITVNDFASRLLELAAKSAAVGDAAAAQVNGRLGLQSVEQESRIITMLAEWFGVDSLEAAELLVEAQAVVRGLGRATAAGIPQDAEALAWYFRDAGAPRVADALLSRARGE